MNQNKIKAIVDFIVGQSEMTVRKKIYRVIFSICMILMIFFGLVAFVGIYSSKDFATEISNEIGNEALEKSSDVIREQTQEDLLSIVSERTNYVKSDLYRFYSDVILIKRELDTIFQHGEYFKPRTVRLGRDFREGDVAALRYAPDA